MKFLVVDDSITMRRIVLNALQRIGYTEVVEAVDGRDALARFDESIGFIITDWNMPVMNGLEFVRELRGRSASAKLPVLMVTTNAEANDIAGAREAGVNDYVVKPFTPDVLKEKMSALLGK